MGGSYNRSSHVYDTKWTIPYLTDSLYIYQTGQPTSRPPSRPTTPNGQNPFDAVPKPHSLTMERIKNQTSATLDRMALLQQRYRQHQEIMKSGGESSRRNSNSSQIEEQLVSILTMWLTHHYITVNSIVNNITRVECTVSP